VTLLSSLLLPQEHLNEADALYYHVPSFNGAPMAKRHPNQLRLAMSLESASYYSLLDSAQFMCQFDAEMTYRQCAQVGNADVAGCRHSVFKLASCTACCAAHHAAHCSAHPAAACRSTSIKFKTWRLLDSS
jgi:hypothetical protein